MRREYFLLTFIVIIAALLRLGWQSISPPGFWADEAGYGYSAYSIVKSGRDEFGSFFPLAFRSFGEFKPPLPVYLTAISVYFLGLSEFSVRLPSIFLSIATVVIIYFLGRAVFKEKKQAWLAAFFLALSPWHILQGRGIFESTIYAFILSLAVFLFLYWQKRNKALFLFLSAFFFSLSFYACQSSRVTTSLILLSFLFLFTKKIFALRNRKDVLLALGLAFLIVVPFLLSLYKNPEILLRRPLSISIFKSKQAEIDLWMARTIDGAEQNTLITRFFHNKVSYFSKEVLRRYFQHFDLSYLFFTGDPHERFQIPHAGLANLSLLPFFFFGFYRLITAKSRGKKLLVFWMLASPLVSSMAIFTPNSLHTLDAVVPFCLICSFGFWKLLEVFKKKAFLYIAFGVVFYFSFVSFLKGYFYTLPLDYQYASNWSWGQKQLIDLIEKYETDYQRVIFFKNTSSHIFPLFYKKYDPFAFQREARVAAEADEGGFQKVETFGKYQFLDASSWDELAEKEKDVLYIVLEEQIFLDKKCEENCPVIIDKLDFGGRPVFKLIAIK